MNYFYKSGSPAETKKFAAVLAKETLKYQNPSKNAFIIGLNGELGAGKTTFIQGFARGLGITKRITSPTFLIIRSYKLKVISYKLFYHVDCYRIERAEELNQLGFKKIISDPANIILIEWVDKIKKLLPENFVWINLTYNQNEKSSSY
jgi:tRNA threonylcarbamoyladenosine biosynthesis protein TsaE